jgi:hypothetical protein
MAPTVGPGSSPVARAERFMWLTARVLEQRRFALHFLGGSGDAVEAALGAYRNDDGGYGHALEPDLRGPTSEPLHVAYALRVLEEIGRCGGRAAEDVCRYLTATSTREGGVRSARKTQAAGSGYPAAPWIKVLDAPPADLTATAQVLSVLHRNRVWHPWLFRATDFCWAALDALERTDPYEALAALAFLDAVPDRSRARSAAERLGVLVRDHRLVVLDPSEVSKRPADHLSAPDGRHYAHDFAPSPDSLGRRWFSDAEIDRSLAFLSDAQEADGGWPVRRRPWAPGSPLEWRPIVTIEALLTLRRYGRLV